MDGNGRWASRRGLPRPSGHRAGASAVRRVIEAAPGLGITTLSLFAFSSDNWGRPVAEVNHLLRLFRTYLLGEWRSCQRNGVRVRVIGRRDRLPASLVHLVEKTERRTASGRRLHLRLAIDYSSRDALLRAAIDGPRNRQDFSRALHRVVHSEPATPDVDLLIRTGGEKRLSDFLLWECAYAELHFTGIPWPEFSAADLQRAVLDFRGRNRRFGRVEAVLDQTATDRRPAAGGLS